MTEQKTNRIELPTDHDERMARARLSLDGLSVGDALGEQFFERHNRDRLLPRRQTPDGPWRYTDDTAMAMSIVDVLDKYGRIDQYDLATAFAARFQAEPSRGYGMGAIGLLEAISGGISWRIAAQALFGGRGSWGNGSAMRVAPLGAYFADNPAEAARQARDSAVVTHAHPEAQAGAIAIAVAAATAWRQRDTDKADRGAALFDAAIAHTPDSEVRDGLDRAAGLVIDEPDAVAGILGSGNQLSCPDTVPFCIWCAARHLDSFEDAIWATASGLGDVDTTCAIVGGIVALATGREGIPADWLAQREPLSEVMKKGSGSEA